VSKRGSPDNLRARLDELEDRVAALEGGRSPAGVPVPKGGEFWVLEKLQERTGPSHESDRSSGSLVFAGLTTTRGAGSLVWQEEHSLPDVMEADWRPAASLLSALAHPIRLELLRRLLDGARSTADLQEIPDLGTTGQLYHHLRDLQAAGLVVQRGRNHYAVAADKVVPCLILVTAAMSSTQVLVDTEPAS
jgi:hypothetical protein